LGALLHDFGKPETTVIASDGKYPAYGHEGAGMWKAREFLRKHFPMFGYARREWILSLVEYHGHPKRMVKDNSDDIRFKRLSLEVNTEQVYHVGVADFTGRIGESSDIALQHLETFKKRCQDLDIWDKYYEVPNSRDLPQAAYSLLRWKVLFGNVKENDEKKMREALKIMEKSPFELMIMVGVPGVGKSTYIKHFYPHIETISMDEERLHLCGNMLDMSKNQEVYEICLRKLKDHMFRRINTIWDATSVSRKLRKNLINIARQHGAQVSIVTFDLPLDVILERNKGRDRIVPEHVVVDYYKKIQSPKPHEYDRLIVVDKDVKYETVETKKSS
jgi:predicted kinase